MTVETLATCVIAACEAEGGQDPVILDMVYVEKWCAVHGTSARLTTILESLPEF